MTPTATPACLHLEPLFDATDTNSHRTARTICATCPALDACRAHLAAELRRIPGGAPIGTWAGQLWAGSKGTAQRSTRRTL